MLTPHFWLLLFTIVWVDLLLSGDNAVVIALVCRDLPKAQRVAGMVLGTGLAVILRVAAALGAAWLLHLPGLRLVGALALIYVAVGMLKEEEDEGDEKPGAGSLVKAVALVGLADISMSIDNVIALVGISHGDPVLMTIGIVISIPFLIAGAGVISLIVDKFPLLVWVGAALLGWVAGDVAAKEPLLARLGASGDSIVFVALGVGLVLLLGLVITADGRAAKTSEV